MNSPALIKQSEILIRPEARGLEFVTNDKDRNLSVGGNDHRPRHPGLDVGTVAARLPHEPKAGKPEHALERPPIDGGNFGHSSLSQPAPSAAPPHATPVPASASLRLVRNRIPPETHRGSQNPRRSRGTAGQLRQPPVLPLPAMGHCWPHPAAWHARHTGRPHARLARCNRCPSGQRVTASIASPPATVPVFLLDSESQLKAAASGIVEEAAKEMGRMNLL